MKASAHALKLNGRSAYIIGGLLIEHMLLRKGVGYPIQQLEIWKALNMTNALLDALREQAESITWDGAHRDRESHEQDLESEDEEYNDDVDDEEEDDTEDYGPVHA